MNHCKRVLITLCMILLLGVAAYAEDSQSLTNEWFGADGSQSDILGIESVTPDDPQVNTLLDQFFALREADFGAQPGIAVYSDASQTAELIAPQVQSAVGSTHQALIDGLEHRINADMLGATVTSFITSITETDTGYEATVYEWTFFDYDDLSDGVGGSDTAGFGTEHRLTLGYDDAGQLQILADDYTESDVLTGEITAQDSFEADLSADQKFAGYISGYDPVKAALYSNKYVNPTPLPGGKVADTSYYNPAYPNYVGQGGDCANFVSQCLTAGGFPTSSQWKSGSAAWINCVYQINYLRSYGTYIAYPSASDILPGSPMYYNRSASLNGEWYHVVICSGHNSAGTPVINGHTVDRYRLPWNFSNQTYIATVQLTADTIEGLTFTADRLIVPAYVSVPLYTSYQASAPSTTLNSDEETTYDVITTFTQNGTKWAAISDDDSLLYIKLQDDMLLESQGYVPKITLPAAVTTNDMLNVTVQPDVSAMQSWTITLTDEAGAKQTVTGTSTTAAVQFDCKDMQPGLLTVTYTGVDGTIGTFTSLAKVKLTEAATVSGTCGDNARWTLDKTTQRLVITGSGAVSSAPWLRFAGNISTVMVYPNITSLPEGAFSGCTVTTIYGQPAFLEKLASDLGATYVALREFADVFPGEWYYDEIYAAYDRGLFNGVSTEEFVPSDSMTRAMMVTVLGRLAGVDPAEYEDTAIPFTDVTSGNYYTPYVAWAYTTGITTGATTTSFAPNQQVTREQAAAFFTRYLEYIEVTLPDCENPPASYSDAASISDYAVPYIQEMTRCGILKGDTAGTVRPNANITRAEAAVMTMRLARGLDEINPSVTPEPEPSTAPTTDLPAA